LQELRKSGQLTIRLDLHFITTVIDTANGVSAIKKLSNLITLSDSQFPSAVLCLRRFAVSAEKFVYDLLQSLELFLSDSNIIITTNQVLFLEIIENTLFLSRKLRMGFKKRDKHIKCVLRSFLILRLIERVLRITENTLIVGTDMVDQRTTARTFSVTNIKAALIAELLTAYDSSDREVCFFYTSQLSDRGYYVPNAVFHRGIRGQHFQGQNCNQGVQEQNRERCRFR